MKTDTEILNEIQDFIVNHLGEEEEAEPMKASELWEAISYISGLVEQREVRQ